MVSCSGRSFAVIHFSFCSASKALTSRRHGPELLKKMLSAKLMTNDLVREIYEALEANGDLTATWVEAKHHAFVKIFGNAGADGQANQ